MPCEVRQIWNLRFPRLQLSNPKSKYIPYAHSQSQKKNPYLCLYRDRVRKLIARLYIYFCLWVGVGRLHLRDRCTVLSDGCLYLWHDLRSALCGLFVEMRICLLAHQPTNQSKPTNWFHFKNQSQGTRHPPTHQAEIYHTISIDKAYLARPRLVGDKDTTLQGHRVVTVSGS